MTEPTVPAASVSDTDEFKASLPQFFILTALWLALGFFLWFMLKSAVVALPVRTSALIFNAWLPEIISGAKQNYHFLLYSVTVEFGSIPGLGTTQLMLEDQ